MRRGYCLGMQVAGRLILLLAMASPCLRASVYGEAPELAAAVAAGTLAPVERRLPENPQIVQPYESVGRYGGTLRLAMLGWSDIAWMDRTMGGESLVRWDPQWTRIVPNLAQSWTINSNATEYVFHLRRGVRWSDGAPFTADDIVFWNTAIFRGNLVRPAAPWLRANGDAVVVEKIDDYTVAFRYTSPNGVLLYGLAGLQGEEPVSYPRHYLGRFHPAINPAGLPVLLAEAGLTNWQDLIRAKLGLPRTEDQKSRWRAAELPRLCAWQLEPGFGYGQTNLIVARRNPYYWKIDTAGNQLPYIDRVEITIAGSAQDLLDLAFAGRIDLGERTLTTAENLPALRDRRAEGGYDFYRIVTDSGNLAAIYLNLNHRDPVRRALYQDRNFRIGLSHAIDRPRIIRDVLKQPGVPCQVAPRPESTLYHDQLAMQFTEHDLEKANEHLNQAGLSQRDNEGWRCDAKGHRLTIVAEIPETHVIRIAALRIVAQNWAEAGIQLQLKVEDVAQLLRNRARNLHDAAVWAGDGGFDVIMDPRNYLPVSDESMQAVLWARWANNALEPTAERPPPKVLEQLALYREVRASPSRAGREERMMRILDLAAQEFPVIGLCTADDITGLVSSRLRNVPPVMMSSGRSFLAPAPVNPCQFYFDAPRSDRP